MWKYLQRNSHFIFGGTALITAFGEGRFNRRLKKLQHLGFWLKCLFCSEVSVSIHRETQEGLSNIFKIKLFCRSESNITVLRILCYDEKDSNNR